MTRIASTLSAFALLAGLGSPVGAQDYPAQPVKIVVPFSGGSATDILARTISDKLAERLGQSVVVENRPGLVGTTTVAKSAPDGYTLILTSNGHTIAGVINRDLPFDPVKDFAGVTLVANVPVALVVPPNSPVKSVTELIALAKANPGKLNFASPGLGSSTFIAGAMFREAAGIDIVHVPYRGGPEALMSVVRGDTQLYFVPINISRELMSAGKIRVIAVATAERVPSMKDIPTVAESGLPGFKYDSWFGVMAPAGTPKPVIARLNREIVAILKEPDVVTKLDGTGAVPLTSMAGEFDAIIAADAGKLAQMFKAGVN